MGSSEANILEDELNSEEHHKPSAFSSSSLNYREEESAPVVSKNKSSFIESAFQKLKESTGIANNNDQNQMMASNEPEQYSYLNDLAFMKNEKKTLQNEERVIFAYFQKRL